MANFAILGVSGEAKVWLVDFDTKTVESVDCETAQALTGVVQDRQNGAAVVKGLDFAVLANSRADVASQGYTQA
jgi:hypothetical protein